MTTAAFRAATLKRADPFRRDLKALSVEDFLSLEIPPREFLLSPWLPSQGVVMVFAQRGVGKTFFGLGVAYAVASGGQFLNWDAPQARKVLYVDGEMPAVAMQERLAGIVAAVDKEAPPDFLRIVTPDLQEVGIPDLSDLSGQSLVDEQLEDAELLILDNLSCLFRGGIENEAESWGPVQEWVLRLRQQHISTMFIHHAGKNGAQRGTSKREDIMDSVIQLKHPLDYQAPDGCRFEIHFDKARGLFGAAARPIDARMETRDGKVFWTTKDSDERMTERVVEYSNLGLTLRQTAKELGVSKSTVSRHRQKAITLGLLKEEKPK